MGRAVWFVLFVICIVIAVLVLVSVGSGELFPSCSAPESKQGFSSPVGQFAFWAFCGMEKATGPPR